MTSLPVLRISSNDSEALLAAIDTAAAVVKPEVDEYHFILIAELFTFNPLSRIAKVKPLLIHRGLKSKNR